MALRGDEGATWQRDDVGNPLRLVAAVAADIIGGQVERKDVGHEGEIVADPHFAPAVENVVAIPKRKRALPVTRKADSGAESLLADLEAARAHIASLTADVARHRADADRYAADLEYIRGVIGKLAA